MHSHVRVMWWSTLAIVSNVSADVSVHVSPFLLSAILNMHLEMEMLCQVISSTLNILTTAYQIKHSEVL